MNGSEREHSSIKMKSRNHMDILDLEQYSSHSIFEGFLREIEKLDIVEGMLFEIKGKKTLSE